MKSLGDVVFCSERMVPEYTSPFPVLYCWDPYDPLEESYESDAPFLVIGIDDTIDEDGDKLVMLLGPDGRVFFGYSEDFDE